jgi:2-C-methyl-D-erythritol 2,4-cyclodiphosphate synthase
VKVRIGIGYDVHRLVDGRRLVLGGVEIAHGRGLLGHSDGDVLIHAISDAILGALALPNIGEAFPNTAKWTDAMDSRKILEYAIGRMAKQGYALSNVDSVLIAQNPKLSPHIAKIRQSIAQIAKVDIGDVGVKATTNEELDSIGSGLAIAAIANVVVVS